MDRRIEPSHFGLQASSGRSDPAIPGQLFDHLLGAGIGGRELALVFFAIGLGQRISAFLHRAMSNSHDAIASAGGQAHASVA